jgi:regulatory protein RepA
MNNDIIVDFLSKRLSTDMYQGNMHKCILDVGRVVGGYLASNTISHSDSLTLCEHTKSLAINSVEAEQKWEKAVEYGKREPLSFESNNSYVAIEDRAFEWDSKIGKNTKVVDTNWISVEDIPLPAKDWSAKKDLLRYLSLLFNDEDIVGYVTDCYQNSESKKYLPKKGAYDRTAGTLIELLKKTEDITDVIGTWQEEAGAWIRFNPLDGKGVCNSNITHHRYALIESDEMTISKQYGIYKELELPIAVLVHSGGKSLHAIVRIDADSYKEYKKRVDFLYKVCKENDLKVDSQNRNPSRLSRLPGVTRNGKKQYIVASNIGKKSWDVWHEWVLELNDDLPEIECLTDTWNNPPKLAVELIHGVLRQGHKMLIAGASKAGKSFDLINLSIAIAEGGSWHGWNITQGKVLYVNLELDQPSCINRFHNVYKALEIPIKNLKNVEIWNLRGKSKTLDKLAPKLIRRASKKNYIAIIIDPIYKVITGDENAADQMASFCNQFDKICTELGSATIYCHHHSKGSQGQKRANDRSSGSGVFARDPDALIDLIELKVTDECRKKITNRNQCKVIAEFLDANTSINWREKIGQDEQLVSKEFHREADRLLSDDLIPDLANAMAKSYQKSELVSAWRIEGTLREFASFKPRTCFFDYPLHIPDVDGLLFDAKAEGEEPPWMANRKTKAETAKERKQERLKSLETAFAASDMGEPVTISDFAEYLGKSTKQVRINIKEHPEFSHRSGVIYRNEKTNVPS